MGCFSSVLSMGTVVLVYARVITVVSINSSVINL